MVSCVREDIHTLLAVMQNKNASIVKAFFCVGDERVIIFLHIQANVFVLVTRHGYVGFRVSLIDFNPAGTTVRPKA